MHITIRNTLMAALCLGLPAVQAQTDLSNIARGNQVRVEKDSAAGRVVATVYEGRFSYVRIEAREPGAALNQHPFEVTPAALRAVLEQARLAGAKPEPLFTAKQLDEITTPLATALGRAKAEQDVSLAVSDQFGFLGPLAAHSVTTARIFRRDGQLQLIAGLVRREFESELRGSGRLIAFEPGQRAKPVERTAKLAVAAGAGSGMRDDWLALSTSVAAAAPAVTAVPATAAAPGTTAAPAAAAAAVAPAAVAPVPAAASRDADALYRSTAERLRALEKLRADGLITEAEYQEKRRQILRDL